MIAWLRRGDPFPPLEQALTDPNGLLAASGDLKVERLINAYRRGIFPWSSAGQPILWWSPDPRMVLYIDEFHVSRSLRKRLRATDYEVRIDTNFAAVIAQCALIRRAGQAGRWITREMVHAYTLLHECHYAHSVESYRAEELVGGLYGIALGGVFFGESMFARATDASKVALVHLVALLRGLDVRLIDCQQETRHLAAFGARPIPRQAFTAHLQELIHSNEPSRRWPVGIHGIKERIEL